MATTQSLDGTYDSPTRLGLSVASSQAIWIIIALGYVSPGPGGLSQLDLFLLSGLELVGFILSALAGYTLYLLINRRNTHIALEQELLSRALGVAKARTPTADPKVFLPLNSAERGLFYYSQSSGEKSAILWGLLAAVPYAGWLAMIYALAFLSSDLRKHEIAEDSIMQEFDRYVRTGSQSLPLRQGWSPSREPVVLAAACLVFLGVAGYGMVVAFEAVTLSTVGLSTGPDLLSITLLALGSLGFLVLLNIWLYWTITDPERHFAFHRHWDALLQSQLGQSPPATGAV